MLFRRKVAILIGSVHRRVQRKYLGLWKPLILVIGFSSVVPVTFAGIEDFGNALDVTLYKLAFENNDSSAQYLIARKYLRGKSVVKNIPEAIRWFEFAEKQGHVKAQYQLGMIYLNGIGVPKNKPMAKKYLLSAANNGLDDAQYQMGQFFQRGYAGTNNIYKAVKWYKKAIDQDNILAQFVLGKMYFDGEGVKQDSTKALKWLTRAAGAGDFKAAKLVAKIQRDMLVSNGSISFSEKNQLDAAASADDILEFTEMSAGEMLQQGMNYLRGEHSFDINVTKGVELLKRAANSEHAVAQYNYGVLLSEGVYVDVDLQQSVKWLDLAAKAGVEPAYSALAKNRLKLILSDKDKYASKPEQQFNLASLYLNGNFIDKNVSEAFQWYLKAARMQHVESQYQVGEMYHAGFGVKQNTEKAKFWLVKASKNGISQADDLLREINSGRQGVFSESEKSESKDFDGEDSDVRSVAAKTVDIKSKRSNNVGNKTAALAPRQKRSFAGTKLDIGVDSSANSKMKKLLFKARRGDNKAQFQLAKNYLDGMETEKNIIRGVEWLTRAADNRSAAAQHLLGKMFLQGRHMGKDFSEAFRLINSAAALGDTDAQLALGDIYKKGLGVNKSNSAAIKWYRRSANNGNAEARRRLGGCRVC